MSAKPTPIPPYNPNLCTYSNLKTLMSKYKTSEEMCKFVANGICNGPHHYLNTYKLYFCYLSENKGLFILITVISIILLFLSLNYIRRSYYARPVLNFRKVLGISDFMSEVVLVPLAFGIVPLAIRLQGAYKDVDLSFNMAATLGSMLTLSTFVIAVCAIVLKLSRKVDKGKLLIDVIFIVISCVLIFVVGLKREVQWIDALILIGFWFVYVFMVFSKGVAERSKI